uniref:Uncharacterized protein n=1 Tax=viral metagenome TaxID=1070528 RepID=A0A6M3J564_9ZZZZ
MSDELRIGLVMSFDKGGAKCNRAETIEVDVTGDAFSHEIQSIPTSNTALVEGAAVGTPGYYFIKNLDATNYVTIGLTASYAIKLLAGEICCFRAAGAIFALANTAACLVEYWVIEE